MLLAHGEGNNGSAQAGLLPSTRHSPLEAALQAWRVAVCANRARPRAAAEEMHAGLTRLLSSVGVASQHKEWAPMHAELCHDKATSFQWHRTHVMPLLGQWKPLVHAWHAVALANLAKVPGELRGGKQRAQAATQRTPVCGHTADSIVWAGPMLSPLGPAELGIHPHEAVYARCKFKRHCCPRPQQQLLTKGCRPWRLPWVLRCQPCSWCRKWSATCC